LIEVSKDSDSSLVSIENLSEILPSSSWAQVRYQQPKMAKSLPYVVTHKKPEIQNFFHCRLEDLPSLQGLNSSLGAIG